MANFDNVNSSIKRILNGANPSKVISDAVNNTLDTNVLESLKDVKSGEINGGIKTLSNNLGKKSISQLTEDLDGLKDQLVKKIDDGNKSDVGLLLGSKGNGGVASDSFLNVTISSPTPEGLKSSVSAIATTSSNDLNNIISNVVPEEYISVLPDAIQNDYNGAVASIQNSINSYKSTLENILNGNSDNLFLDLIFKTDQTILRQLSNLGVFNTNVGEIIKILQSGDTLTATKHIIQISTGLEPSTIDIILKNPDSSRTINELLVLNDFKPIENNKYADRKLTEIEREVGEIKPSAANQFQSDLKDTAEVYDPKSNSNKWNGSKTNNNIFTTVTSEEELMIEFNSSVREITRIVFFPYNVSAGQTLTSRDVHKLENLNKSNGINMHYLLRTDGTLQRGRPIDIETEAFENANKYTIAIGVVYHDTVRPIQSTTVEQILRAFYNRWSGGSVYSANQVDTQFDTLDIDLNDYITIFDKVNYGSVDEPQSTEELIKLAIGN